MLSGQMVFAQLMEFLPRHEFNTCVCRYGGDGRLRGFSCRDQFLCPAFAQLTFRESLHDIETRLRALRPKRYHAGFRRRVSCSTLANANLAHDWRIYADCAQVLIGQARRLYADEALAVMLEQTVTALDPTTIDLYLTLFPWAKVRRRTGAVKRHTLLDLRGNIPAFVPVSHGKVHDVTVLDQLPIEPGAFYVMDRGDVDFARRHRFTRHSTFFVTRAKRNLDDTRRVWRKIEKTTGLRSDQTLLLAGVKLSRLHPDPLRRVSYHDAETDRRFVFLANNFPIPTLTVVGLYKSRWQVELSFKWIKQNLRIKTFFGTSENAVKTPVWIAISTCVLVAILKRELKVDRSMSAILQIPGLTLFEKTPVIQALTAEKTPDSVAPNFHQMTLLDL